MIFALPSGRAGRYAAAMLKINRVQIANYKSIEALDFEARRVTVFIGGPNTGKSNILESLALLSPGMSERFKEYFRIHHAGDLFYDQDRKRIIEVKTTPLGRGWKLRFDRASGRYGWTSRHESGGWPEQMFNEEQLEREVSRNPPHSPIRAYLFRADLFAGGKGVDLGFLSPPYGSNLGAILTSDRAVRESISFLFKEHHLRLEVRMPSSEILVSKFVDDVLFSYPFSAVSETLRRIAFLKAALETNTDAVLILDEPEANTFPFYTKYLAERIALDETNQFFLTTHNPYVLMSIIEKTPTADLAVYVTRMRNYRTEVHLLTGEELVEALDLGMACSSTSTATSRRDAAPRM
ncbi:MAG TPA: AAA family ATPase, partial [Verrucomicrobiota bacterium]|nr:AAA family ATPase [Verrucomicrobiota bacterium]